MSRRAIQLALCVLLALLGVGANAQAATFVLISSDADGEGFSDSSPPHAASTQGGNTGATLGEQRLNALQYAMDTWGALLDSSIPIVVLAGFEELECEAGAVLGSAGAASVYASFEGAPYPGVWYPSALADRLAGEDLGEGEPDIVASFNADVDGSCLGASRFYYGYDASPPPGDVDFVAVALHELAHGLGFANYVEEDTGQFLPALGNIRIPDIYSVYTFDNSVNLLWPNMTAAQRVASAVNVRNVVWVGQSVTDAAPSVLAPGMPILTEVPWLGLSGVVDEAYFGPRVADSPVVGQLELTDPPDACSVPTNLSGKVALIRRGTCTFMQKVVNAELAGATAAIVHNIAEGGPPGSMYGAGELSIGIPSLRIDDADGELLEDALENGDVFVDLSPGPEPTGTSPEGHVYLNATDPVSRGSSISHWEPIARRVEEGATPAHSLLMEPAITDHLQEVDLTLQQLQDIGWVPFECGNGEQDPDEACDDGNLLPGDGCSTACKLERCGDGLVNNAGQEDCDDGYLNTDDFPDACRTNCKLPGCGDGQQDNGEECDDQNTESGDGCSSECIQEYCGDGIVNNVSEACDDGEDNNDEDPDACRTNCAAASCGDGVQDTGEACDDGEANSDTLADACRTNCQLPSCGDEVVDDDEECDDGNAQSGDGCTDECVAEFCGDDIVNNGGTEACDMGDDNSDTEPDACRTNCQAASCGDGVADSDEQCDQGAGNSDTEPDACRSGCVEPSCGDSVMDSDEQCDDGPNNSDTVPDACRADCSPARCGDGVQDSVEQCDNGPNNSDSVADACRSSCQSAHCGDGVADTGEQCDQGSANSNTLPDACRVDCSAPRCGDNVTDSGEACDDGAANSDTVADACRSNCVKPSCGDHVVDSGEQCDSGPDNSDTLPNACRTDCAPAHCGDGVMDTGEECDSGAANSDEIADACRTSCVLPRCGDGVTDTEEECDSGADNSDETPDACRTDCAAPSCGDGVTDTDEQCDNGADNNDSVADGCRLDCRAAHCGDGVVDTGEMCDAGLENSDEAANACRSDCTPARCGDGVVDDGETCDDGNEVSGDGCDAQCAVEIENIPEEPGAGVDAGPQGVDAGAAPSTDTETAVESEVQDPSHALAPQESADAGVAGCSCRTVGQTSTSNPWWLALAALGFGWMRRRTASPTNHM